MPGKHVMESRKRRLAEAAEAIARQLSKLYTRRPAWINDLQGVGLESGVDIGSPGRQAVEPALARLSGRCLYFSRRSGLFSGRNFPLKALAQHVKFGLFTDLPNKGLVVTKSARAGKRLIGIRFIREVLT